MASLDLSLYKKVDPESRDLISGYIRRAQKLFSCQTAYYNIPTAINHLCALFYYLAEDEWDKDRMGSQYEIDQDTNALLRKSCGPQEEQSVYLTNVAESGTHHWRFKLTFNSLQYIDIGVVRESVDPQLITPTYLGQHANTVYVLSLQHDKLQLNVHDQANQWKSGFLSDVELKEITVLDMFLDLNALELSYAIDGKRSKAFDVNGDHGYIAVVSINTNSGGNRVELLSYDITWSG